MARWLRARTACLGAVCLAVASSAACSRTGLFGDVGSIGDDGGPTIGDDAGFDSGTVLVPDASPPPTFDASPAPIPDAGPDVVDADDASDAGAADVVKYCRPFGGGVSATVDGLPVTFLSLPTADITSGLTPTSLSAGANFSESTTNSWGATNPFVYSAALDGSEYDALWAGTATYDYPSAEGTLGILWGTIDPSNALAFYDAQGALLGTISGADLAPAAQQALGSAYTWIDGVNLIVTPPATFRSIVVTGGADLTFEYSNLVATPPGDCPP